MSSTINMNSITEDDSVGEVSSGNTSDVYSDLEEEEEKETTATMLVLMNAIAECRNKNVKKACVEFNESYNATYSNDDLFTSKLLELSFDDLELLYQTVVGSSGAGDGRSRRSSKQNDNKKGSFKKKTSISESSSFANAAYEGCSGEMRSASSSSSSLGRKTSSSSLGRKRSQVSLSDQENIQGRSCLRKAFMLVRDLHKPEYQNTQSEAFLTIANIHVKVENFYSCAVLCVGFKEKFTVERFLSTLNKQEVGKIAEFCQSIGSSKGSSGFDTDSRINFAKVAVKLNSESSEPVALLCSLYRLNNETEKAIATTKVFLEEIDPNNENIMALKLICMTDNARHNIVISHLESFFIQHQPCDYKQLSMLLSIVYVLNGEPGKGMTFLDEFDIMQQQQRDNVDPNNNRSGTNEKKMFASLLELLKLFNLQRYVTELYTYLTTLLVNINNDQASLKKLLEKKSVLSLGARLLAYKHEDKIEIAKLYVDCLHLCGNGDKKSVAVAQAFLVKLVKEYPEQTLPMVYLANVRLKTGAYLASTEDFRIILKLSGEENLTNNLSQLSLDERKEIARVHRLHGVRFLGNECAFNEAAECFTVVLCAIGSMAPGLYLSRGYCFMHLNNFDEAERDFKECIDKKEFVTAALCARSVLYAVTTHVEEALRDFQNAFNSDPSACQKCLPKLPFEHVTVFSQMIIQYIKQGIEETLKVLESHEKLYIENNIDSIENMETVATVEATTAQTSEKQPKLDQSVLRYNEFLCKVFPCNVDYVSTYIECLHLTDDQPAMQIAIDRALEAFSGEPQFKAWKGILLSKQKHVKEAIDSLKPVVGDVSNKEVTRIITCHMNNKARKQIFDQCMRKGRRCVEKKKENRYTDAVNYFSLASALFIKDVTPIRERMECYRCLGVQDKWLTDMACILRLEPTIDDYCVRAAHHHAQGEDLNACEDYINALELGHAQTVNLVAMNSNTDGVTHLFYATALSLGQINKTKSSQRLCEAGLKFDPNHKELRQLADKTTINKCTIQ